MKLAVGAILTATVLAACVVAAAPAAAQQPPDSIGIRLLDGPTDPSGGLAGDRISYVLPAGGSATWTVEVHNAGSEDRAIPLHVGAAELRDGQFQPADDLPGAELPGWITIEPSAPLVSAGERAEATVTVDVPDDATDGDHAAAVWASATAEGTITQINRVGLRVLITVADGVPAAGFEIGEIGVDGERPHLTVEVVNTGGRMLEVAGTADLHGGPGGVSVGELPLLRTTIATGDTGTLTAPLDPDLPAGEWQVDVEIVGDGLTQRATGTVTIGGLEPAEPPDARRWLVALALLLLLVTLLLWLWARRRGDGEDGSDEDVGSGGSDGSMRSREPSRV